MTGQPDTRSSLDADDYAALNVRQEWVERDDFTGERYRQFSRYLPPLCRRVLDVGCGWGRGGAEIRAAYPYVVLSGLDCIPARIERVPLDTYREAFVGNATDVPFGDHVFDAIVAGEVIEHLTPVDVVRALAEFRRTLAPDGVLLMTTPNPGSLKLRLSGGSILNAAHLSAHPPRALRTQLRDLGYVDITVHGSGRATRRFGDRLPFLWVYGSYLVRAISP